MFMASPPASARRFGPAIGDAALARLTWVYLRRQRRYWIVQKNGKLYLKANE